MTLPEVRKALFDLAKNDETPPWIRVELDNLARETYRRRRAERKDNTARPMTDALRKELREFARSHPDWAQDRIARVHNVNQGRVSEALHGWRE